MLVVIKIGRLIMNTILSKKFNFYVVFALLSLFICLGNGFAQTGTRIPHIREKHLILRSTYKFMVQAYNPPYVVPDVGNLSEFDCSSVECAIAGWMKAARSNDQQMFLKFLGSELAKESAQRTAEDWEQRRNLWAKIMVGKKIVLFEKADIGDGYVFVTWRAIDELTNEVKWRMIFPLQKEGGAWKIVRFPETRLNKILFSDIENIKGNAVFETESFLWEPGSSPYFSETKGENFSLEKLSIPVVDQGQTEKDINIVMGSVQNNLTPEISWLNKGESVSTQAEFNPTFDPPVIREAYADKDYRISEVKGNMKLNYNMNSYRLMERKLVKRADDFAISALLSKIQGDIAGYSSYMGVNRLSKFNQQTASMSMEKIRNSWNDKFSNVDIFLTKKLLIGGYNIFEFILIDKITGKMKDKEIVIVQDDPQGGWVLIDPTESPLLENWDF
jgi:hypothetical protein